MKFFWGFLVGFFFLSISEANFQCNPNQWTDGPNEVTLKAPYKDQEGNDIVLSLCLGEGFCPNGRDKTPNAVIACLLPEDGSTSCEDYSPKHCGDLGAYTYQKFDLDILSKYLYLKRAGVIPKGATYNDYARNSERHGSDSDNSSGGDQ